ncbi:MAG: TrmB family transcriptional regulator [Candidatus Bathyarchaeia archaeon]
MKREERIETLMQLGLTLNQARLYIALTQLSQATAKELSAKARMSRQDIYRVMPELERASLVERIVTLPTLFRAFPVESGISILLKRKIAEQNQLRKRTEELLCDVKSNHVNDASHEESQFVIVPGGETIIQRLRESVQKAQRTVESVTVRKRFSQVLLEFHEDYEKALARGVRIRIVTEKALPEGEALKIAGTLMKSPLFEVRTLSNSPKAMVSIFDGKEAFVKISTTVHLKGTPALWSNDGSFVVLAQNYFECNWNSAGVSGNRQLSPHQDRFA